MRVTKFTIGLLTIAFLSLVGLTSCGQQRQATAWSTFDKQINELIAEHERFMNEQFKIESKEFNDFDKIFFTDFTFMKSDRTVDFFKRVSDNIESGRLPHGNDEVSIEYTGYSNINGKTTGINYRYTSDGKKITLVKDTLNNGKTLEDVYNYDIHGKLLTSQEIKDGKIITTATHKLRT